MNHNKTLEKQKNIAMHPDHQAYLKQWAALYDGKNYDSGLTGYFLKKSHEWSELRFGPDVHFARVLEVGAGTGMHLKYVRHSFDEYMLTDLNPPLMDKIELGASTRESGKVIIATEDATSLSFPDNSFDRVIAAHVLEHLYRPHDVLHEWGRVLKPGGILTLVLPCDPGVLWRLGRFAVARGQFIKAGLLYDYWMAREHVNPINGLVAFIHHYFSDVSEEWLPMRIPSIDFNLFYIAHITV
jgi:phosphatidylethanolamine/phosphatidyl-N-methylethanolamine N-methyltransferase